MNKKTIIYLIFFALYILILLSWFSFLEKKWFEVYYGVSLDYLREEIYGFEYFLISSLVILIAYFFLKKRIISFLLGTVSITNVPVISSGVGLIYNGPVTLLMVTLIFQLNNKRLFAKVALGPAGFLLLYFMAHSLLTLSMRYNIENSIHIVMIIKLFILIISIYAIALIYYKINMDTVIIEAVNHGLKYQVLTILILVALIIYLIYSGHDFGLSPYAFHSMFSIDRLTLGFNHPNELALYLVGMTPYLMAWLERRSPIMIILYSVLFILICSLVMSRALIFSLFLIVLIYRGSGKFNLLLKGLIIFCLPILFALIGWGRVDDFYSIDSRRGDYEAVLEVFINDPVFLFFGYGFGISGYGFYQPHNIVVDLVYNVGLFGLFFYFLFMLNILRHLIKNDSVGFCSLFGVLAYGMFHSLWTTWLFYFFIAFALIHAAQKRNSEFLVGKGNCLNKA